MNPLNVALKGKGPFKLAHRMISIGQNYGLTPAKVEGALALLADTLHRFDCNGTFPTVAAVLARHPQVFQKYQVRGLEFAIHGYQHIDYAGATPSQQLTHLQQAKKVFDQAGIRATGFRGPYLHANTDTLAALRNQLLAYDSSPSLTWDILNGGETAAYRHVVEFYGARPANDYPSLPYLEDGLVRIPYSLPDDEALANRLGLKTTAQMNAIWLAVLRRSYELGELFTLGLHPERAFICHEPLTAVLSEARRLQPAVWIARLDEIAAWWQARSEAQVKILDMLDNKFQISVSGPPGVTTLVRETAVDAPTCPWAAGYHQVLTTTFTLQAAARPWIGLAPDASPALSGFLRQQGYITETGQNPTLYTYYFNQTSFAAEDQRPLLAQIEQTGRPLVRLGGWPYGARSALAITGDIDCITLWDYVVRFMGN